MDIVYLIAYASFLSPLFALGLSLRIKNISYELRLIQILLATSLVVDLISLWLGVKGHNTYPIGNIFFLFQSVLFLLIFRRVLSLDRIMWYVIGVYFLFFVINFAFVQGPFILNSHSHSLSAVILIFFCLLYFRYLLIELPEMFIYRLPMVWINLSILIYYSGNLFLFILNNHFTNGEEGNQRVMWIIHNSLNIVKNSLFIISTWQSLRKTSSSSY